MNREPTVPFYLQVAETIRGRIQEGLYLAGGLIPPARDLEREFKVSNITIRKALGLLVQDGLVVRRRGVGTIVARRHENLVAIRLSGDFREWFDSASGKRPRLEVDVLDMSLIPAPRPIQAILGLRTEGSVWRMRRIRRFRGQPVSYFLNYGRPESCQRITAAAVKDKSFVEVFQESSGIRFHRIEQRVEAVAASMDLAAILEAEFGSPLFFVENIYYSAEDEPVEVTHMYYRGDKYVYKATMNL